MRYIYYIILISLILSAIIGYELSVKPASKGDAAIIINERIISNDEFNKLYDARSPYHQNKQEFINSLITKELLIQESQKEGIDKEESFRRSIQNFYEQSLIKLLMDRKFSSLDITVSEDEFKKYTSFLRKRLYVTIFSFDNFEEAKKGEYKNGEQKIISFDELSLDVQFDILLLTEGDMTEPIKTAEKFLVIRLDKAEPVSSETISPKEKEEIRMMLIEKKREKMINDWIADLREKAIVNIYVNGQNRRN